MNILREIRKILLNPTTNPASGFGKTTVQRDTSLVPGYWERDGKAKEIRVLSQNYSPRERAICEQINYINPKSLETETQSIVEQAQKGSKNGKDLRERVTDLTCIFYQGKILDRDQVSDYLEKYIDIALKTNQIAQLTKPKSPTEGLSSETSSDSSNATPRLNVSFGRDTQLITRRRINGERKDFTEEEYKHFSTLSTRRKKIYLTLSTQERKQYHLLTSEQKTRYWL
jgi:hypothetical protein